MSPLARRLTYVFLFALGIAAPLIGNAFGVGLLSPAAREVSRTPSPDSLHDVVVVSRQSILPYSRPATEVYVVNHGLKISRSDAPGSSVISTMWTAKESSDDKASR